MTPDNIIKTIIMHIESDLIKRSLTEDESETIKNKLHELWQSAESNGMRLQSYRTPEYDGRTGDTRMW